MSIKRFSPSVAAVMEERTVYDRFMKIRKTVYVPVETVCAEPADVDRWVEQKRKSR